MQLNGWKEKCLHSFFCGDILIHSLPEWNSSLRKRVIAWDPNCARIYGIIWGGPGCKQTWRKAKWNVSAGLKQLKIAKRKVELGGKKNMTMWSWRKKMCLRQFYLEKNQKNAPWNSFRDGFFAVEPKQSERKLSSYKGKYARTGKFLKLFVQKNTTTCMSCHNSRCTWLLDLSPRQSHNWVRA